MKSQSSLNMGHVGSKSRSVGQIIEKPCGHDTGPIIYPVIMKICPNDHLDIISDKFEYGSCQVKN